MTSLDRLVSEGLVETGVVLGRLTTYKLGGPARYFAEVPDRERLGRIVGICPAAEAPVLVLGRGSNVVIGEGGFDGLVLRLGAGFTDICHPSDEVVAGGAAPLPVLARSAVAAGRLGLEFFVGVPGTVGGAVHQNAGCHGSETVDRLEWALVADLVTGTMQRRETGDLGLGYRHSNLSSHQLVVEAGFSFTPGPPADGERVLREITRWRRDHQPGGTFNAGSVFKNPPGEAAGHLIDRLGLKGLRVGDASVSEKHANFFVAGPAATPSDLRRLVADVARRVEEETGIRLEPEIQFVGTFAR